MLLFFVCAAAAATAGWFGWRSFSATDPPEPNTQSDAVSAGNVALDRDGVWQSEIDSDSADQWLKQLSQVMTADRSPDAFSLENLVSKSISFTSIRPIELVPRLSNTSLTIRRGVVEGLPVQTGIAGFESALKAASEPLASMSDIHSKFKIVGIQRPSIDFLTAEVVVQRAGHSNDSAFQQDARWKCGWSLSSEEGESELLLTSLELLEYEEAVYSGRSAMFVDCTESAFANEPAFAAQLSRGIDHWRRSLQKQYGVFPFGHHGISIGDVNGDGLEDIYLGQPSGLPNRLLIQQPDGTLRDQAGDAQIDLLDRTRGVLLVDFDNDGDLDLAAVLDELIIFMENISKDGAPSYRQAVELPTIEPGSLSVSDYDRDGDLDVYVVNYGNRFENSPEIYHDANNGNANVLLRNDGNWTFTDVTAASGLDENNRRWSFAATWEDYDNDGDPDLYVANDFGRNNLYRNTDGSFEDVAASAGVEDIAAGMSASWGDFDHDGAMDLYVGNMFSSAGLRVTGQARFQSDASAEVRSQYRRHARGNSLFRNLKNGSFEDVSESANVTIGRWAWDSKFVDINNDGWEDLIVTNGFVTGTQTKDL